MILENTKTIDALPAVVWRITHDVEAWFGVLVGCGVIWMLVRMKRGYLG